MRLRSIKQIQGALRAPFCCCCCLWVCCQGCLTTLTNVLNKWQAALAGFPCTSNVLLEVNPAIPLLLGRDGRNSSGRTSCFVGSQPPCSGVVHMELWKSWSCGHKWWVWWGGNIYLPFFIIIIFLSLQLRHVRPDLPVSFSVLGQRVTFFMMALYRPHYLPFYYLKFYYLFMHEFNLPFCNEVLSGRTWRFRNAVAVDLASPGVELMQGLFI